MIAVTGVLAGCGTIAAGAKSASGAGKTSNTSKSAPPKVSLTVSIINETHKPKHFVLTCQPTGGNAPDAQALCKSLLAMKRPFTPPAKHLMCPMIMISDHQIIVKGTWFGQKVERVITDGGCDLGLFNAMDKVLH
ncbi:MAG TPA: SSI family serine proteinase inhibitor [Streptosporangiaceae bacterium]|nr:SSI family serine proteinase inhibitor [Streptosporangiaceae bacterium]